MDLAARENMDRKLIELVKPHEILYNGISNSHDCVGTRTELWNSIGEEMNQIFNVDRCKCYCSLSPSQNP